MIEMKRILRSIIQHGWICLFSIQCHWSLLNHRAEVMRACVCVWDDFLLSSSVQVDIQHVRRRDRPLNKRRREKRRREEKVLLNSSIHQSAELIYDDFSFRNRRGNRSNQKPPDGDEMICLQIYRTYCQACSSLLFVLSALLTTIRRRRRRTRREKKRRER